MKTFSEHDMSNSRISFSHLLFSWHVLNIFFALPQTNQRLNIATSFFPWHAVVSIFTTFSMPELCVNLPSFICWDADNGADMHVEPGLFMWWLFKYRTCRRCTGAPSPAMTRTNAFTWLVISATCHTKNLFLLPQSDTTGLCLSVGLNSTHFVVLQHCFSKMNENNANVLGPVPATTYSALIFF